MRAAPAVDAALSDGRVARGMLLLLHLAVALVMLGWAAAWDPNGWLAANMGALSALLLLGAALLGHRQARHLLPTTPQRLRWDGQGWQLMQHGQPPAQALAAVFVQIDLGAALLLRLRAAAPGVADRWALATARAAASDWHGLRIALQHHAGATRTGQDGGLAGLG